MKNRHSEGGFNPNITPLTAWFAPIKHAAYVQSLPLHKSGTNIFAEENGKFN